MTRKAIGLIAVVGSALGAWWWTSQRRVRMPQVGTHEAHDKGTVIFDNTPTPSDVDAII